MTEDSKAPTQHGKAEDEKAEEAKVDEAVLRREAARRLGQARTERKAQAVRENGKKGGRPPGTRTSEEARVKMQEAQRKRREREQGNSGES